MNMQLQNAAIHARFMAGEFRVLCADGRIIGTGNKDKCPISVSTRSVAQRRNPKVTAAKRARYLKNRAIRSDLNREMNSGKSMPDIHTRLDALSRGAA